MKNIARVFAVGLYATFMASAAFSIGDEVPARVLSAWTWFNVAGFIAVMMFFAFLAGEEKGREEK